MRTGRVTLVLTAAALALVVAAVTGPAFAGTKKREKHVDKWPVVDLSGYSVLYIEDFRMADDKATERKRVVQVKGAPKRLADYVVQALDEGVFHEVHRGRPDAVRPGALVLKADITQYKPGSKVGRAMMAGAGSAHLDLKVRLVSQDDGKELTSFDAKRTWAWGGAMGMSKGVEEMEQNVAHELALYLQKCKTGKTGS